MKISNIRIDVRLIHGQVAAMWINTLGVTRLMVVDQLACKDEMLKSVLKLACPGNVKLSILSPQKAAQNLLAEKYPDDRIMMVARGPQTLLQLYQEGYHMDTVNVGNMANSPGTKMIKKSIHVTPEDIACFLALDDLGVKFTAQMYPNEEPFDFIAAIKRAQ